MTRFNIHPKARGEFDEAFKGYLVIDAELAKGFETIFFHHLDAVLANPLLYNLRRGVTRRVNLIPRFGEYYIAYMIWREKVVILAVAHAKRKPYYWRGRIGESKKMF